MRGAAPERADQVRYAAGPVSNYWQALRHLAERVAEAGEDISSGEVSWVVGFVADLFGLWPGLVRADLEAYLRSV